MKCMGFRRVFVVIPAIVAASCIQGRAARPMESKQAKLGDSFSLKVGESTRIDEVEVTLTFQKVSSDSRCPKDVTCIQAGEAVVVLSIETGAGGRSVLELAVPPGG